MNRRTIFTRISALLLLSSLSVSYNSIAQSDNVAIVNFGGPGCVSVSKNSDNTTAKSSPASQPTRSAQSSQPTRPKNPQKVSGTKMPDYWTLWAYYHTKMGTPIGEEQADCWNYSFFGQDLERGKRDEFFMEDIRVNAIDQMREKLALKPNEQALFKFSAKNTNWNFGKYDRASQSFPIDSYGFDTEIFGDGGYFYVDLDGGRYSCISSGRKYIVFNNNKNAVDRAAAFKIPEDKARAFLGGRPGPRALYIDLYFYLQDVGNNKGTMASGAKFDSRYVVARLTQVDFYNDPERKEFLYSAQF